MFPRYWMVTWVLWSVLLIVSSVPVWGSEQDEPRRYRVDAAAALNSWRTYGEGHAGYQFSLAVRVLERHRVRARHVAVSNEFSNALSALKDILSLCDLRSECESGDRPFRTIREEALVYEYRVWSRSYDRSAAELWLGAGAGRVKKADETDQDMKEVRRHTGAAWSVEITGRGDRFFTSLSAQGNSEINGTLVGVGVGVSLP